MNTPTSPAASPAMPQTARRSKIKVPLPGRDNTKLLAAWIPRQLHDTVKRVAKSRGANLKQVAEWGLRVYLMEACPKEEKNLGVEQG